VGVVVGMLVGRAGMLVDDGLDLTRRELAGEHNAASFLPLLGQLLGDLRVMRLALRRAEVSVMMIVCQRSRGSWAL
jgi:hypothetical protein